MELPLVIHCRDAFDEVFEVLEEHRGMIYMVSFIVLQEHWSRQSELLI